MPRKKQMPLNKALAKLKQEQVDEQTEKEYKFAEYVAHGLQRTEAYIAAGFTTKCPRQSAYKLVQKPHIQALIDAELDSYKRGDKIQIVRAYRNVKKMADAEVDPEGLKPSDVLNANKVVLQYHGALSDAPVTPTVNYNLVLIDKMYQDLKEQGISLDD